MKQPMKKNALTVVGCLLALILTSCGVKTGQPLNDIHTEGQLDELSYVEGNPCLECHSSEIIIKATENYSGDSSLNLHKPPEQMLQYYGDCMTCHLMDTSPVITCNQCHAYKLPSGWKEATSSGPKP